MSRRPFDPGEIDRDATGLESATGELERYAALTNAATPVDLDDRVMAAVEREPIPRRGILAWLALPAPAIPLGRVARAVVLTAALVLVVGGVLAAGQLARIIRDASVGGPSSSPTDRFTPSPSPSVLQTPSPSDGSSPTETIDANASAQPLVTPRATGGSGTPDEQHTESPSPTATQSPKLTPEETQHPS